jgi:hypothetical protein
MKSYMLTFIVAALALVVMFAGLPAGVALAFSVAAVALTGRDVHIDVPLSNIAVEAFSRGDYIGTRLFPIVGVNKQSDIYYVMDKDSWLSVPRNTLRAPKTSPRRVEFKVSSETYFAHNYALAGENAFEIIANADNPIQVRSRTTRFVTDQLLVDLERRIAAKVSSISNIGSGVALTGAQKWSNYLGSDPIADVTTGHAFIRNNTGIRANTLLLDFDTHQILRRHPVLLDMHKYTQAGYLTDANLKEMFNVQNLWVANAIQNVGIEGGAASITNIWGNIGLLAYINPQQIGLQTVTLGLGMRWTPENIPAPMQTSVYNDPDPGKKVEVTEVGYYQDEKIVARQLAYAIKDTL